MSLFSKSEKNIEMAMIHIEPTRINHLGKTRNLANEKTPGTKTPAKLTWDEWRTVYLPSMSSWFVW